MNYEQKYLKYKKKYLEMKAQVGGQENLIEEQLQSLTKEQVLSLLEEEKLKILFKIFTKKQLDSLLEKIPDLLNESNDQEKKKIQLLELEIIENLSNIESKPEKSMPEDKMSVEKFLEMLEIKSIQASNKMKDPTGKTKTKKMRKEDFLNYLNQKINK